MSGGAPAAGLAAGKTMTIAEAVRRFVRPGQTLHLSYGGGRPNAAVAEIIRQYQGTSPGFTVSAQGFVSTQHALVEAGLVHRLVVAFAGENYPSPRPSPALRRAVSAGTVQIENWSLWTLTARLMAGALGTGVQPVRSLAGSGLADEHAGSRFTTIEALGASTGLVAELRPDVVLLQALAADPEGNVILAPPYGERAWGALAAVQGVIACVERVVDSDFIRAHNTLPMIPAHAVLAVCHAPFGSHPYGMDAAGLPGVPGYAEDEPFMAEVRACARQPETFAAWIRKWITDTGSHDGYLAALGDERRSALRGPAGTRGPGRTGAPSEDERMTLALVRVLRDRISAAGHDVVLSGIGFAHLAAWTAVTAMQDSGTAVQLAAELGMSGFVPQPGDPYLFALQNLPTCLQLTDIADVLGRDVAGPGTSCLGVLGAGIVDQHGNINSTWSGGQFLVGSGGANDVASAADDVAVVIKHAPDRLVPAVEYITAPGSRVSVIVTSLAVLERQDGRFVAVRYLCDATPDAAAERISEQTGWPVAIDPGLCREPDPDPADLDRLRGYDPAGAFLR
jgi:acyl CoA:acetate/3-ketoacid CoA transferase alpha subunit/acyl CoA:acetate/3-ketoacid CoA transferase beta subunit